MDGIIWGANVILVVVDDGGGGGYNSWDFFFLSIKMVLLWVLILGMGFDVAMSFDFTMASFDCGLIYGSLISLERDRFKLRRRGRNRETHFY